MKQVIVALMFLAAIVFAACNNGSSSETTKDTSGTTVTKTDTSESMIASVKYTCTMHPEVISDTAGKCPKCGMEMVPMTDSMMKMHKDAMMKTCKDSMMK